MLEFMLLGCSVLAMQVRIVVIQIYSIVCVGQVDGKG